MKTQEEIKDLADIHIVKRLCVLGRDHNEDTRSGFIKGYTQCQEDMADKKYTEEDLRNAFFSGGVMKDVDEFNHFINSLNKQD